MQGISSALYFFPIMIRGKQQQMQSSTINVNPKKITDDLSNMALMLQINGYSP